MHQDKLVAAAAPLACRVGRIWFWHPGFHWISIWHKAALRAQSISNLEHKGWELTGSIVNRHLSYSQSVKLRIPEVLVEGSSGGLLSNLLLRIGLSTALDQGSPSFVLPKLGNSQGWWLPTSLWPVPGLQHPPRQEGSPSLSHGPPKVQGPLQFVLLTLVGTAEKGLAPTTLQVPVGCC